MRAQRQRPQRAASEPRDLADPRSASAFQVSACQELGPDSNLIDTGAAERQAPRLLFALVLAAADSELLDAKTCGARLEVEQSRCAVRTFDHTACLTEHGDYVLTLNFFE